MSCVPAPACKALLAEATRLWPKRSKASDGICPSAAHTSANPTSDHEKGLAADLTDDPANGCAAHVLAEQIRLRRDVRVKYIISRSRIASANPIAGYPAWAWRPYSGSNPHNSHMHVSIHASARDDTSPWFSTPSVPPPPPQPPIDYPEDKMRSHNLRIELRASDGTGWAPCPAPKSRIVACEVNGMDIAGKDPGQTGRAIVTDSLKWGEASRIVVRAMGPGAGAVDVTVWEVTG